MIRNSKSIAAFLILASTSLQAVSKAETYETLLSGDEKRPSSQVSFNASCGDECYAANLECASDGVVHFTFADIEAKIAARAMSSDAREFAIKVGGKAYSFSIMKLSYGGEMYGTWLVDGNLTESENANFLGALAKAKEFKASIGSESLTLPVSADVKTWSAACKQK